MSVCRSVGRSGNAFVWWSTRRTLLAYLALFFLLSRRQKGETLKNTRKLEKRGWQKRWFSSFLIGLDSSLIARLFSVQWPPNHWKKDNNNGKWNKAGYTAPQLRQVEQYDTISHKIRTELYRTKSIVADKASWNASGRGSKVITARVDDTVTDVAFDIAQLNRNPQGHDEDNCLCIFSSETLWEKISTNCKTCLRIIRTCLYSKWEPLWMTCCVR